MRRTKSRSGTTKPSKRTRRKASPHIFDQLGAISDEAAGVIAQLLGNLHTQFDACVFGEIRRHHETIRPSATRPYQLQLPGLSDSDEDPLEEHSRAAPRDPGAPREP